MLVLSSRIHDKIILPDFGTAIEVVSIQPGSVRLGIDAPADVRVLREGIPDRVAEWGAPAEGEAPTLLQVKNLMDRRLEIARRGLDELRRHLECGRTEDAETVLEKLDEDLHLLRRRVRREVEKAVVAAGQREVPEPIVRSR
jgi:carbon storage regulator CsrA